MRLLVDTHGHLDLRHDPHRLLRGARDRLETLALASGADPFRLVFCLLDRAGQSAMESLRTAPVQKDWTAESCSADPAALRIRFPDGPDLWVCAGRQVATAERLEVLGLGPCPPVPDRLPLGEILTALRRGGTGAIILPWAFGKWTGSRGLLIRDRLLSEPPASLLLGDSSLRPRGFPEESLLKLGRAHGFRIVAGTDPLPAAGEEEVAGSYATCLEGDWEDGQPAESLVRALTDPRIPLRFAGRRSAPWTVAHRLIRAACAKKS
jgi:hypothetical protein